MDNRASAILVLEGDILWSKGRYKDKSNREFTV